MIVIQIVQYFDLKVTNDNFVTVLQRQALKYLTFLLLNLRPLMHLKNAYMHLLLLHITQCWNLPSSFANVLEPFQIISQTITGREGTNDLKLDLVLKHMFIKYKLEPNNHPLSKIRFG